MKPSLISFGVSGTNLAVSAFVSVQADALPLQESLFVSSRFLPVFPVNALMMLSTASLNSLCSGA